MIMRDEWSQMEARLLNLELNNLSKEDLLRTFGTDDTAKLVFAVTKALKESVKTGQSPLTLWIHESYGRNGIVTIGMNEYLDRVNLEAARQYGVPVFVRESGGWTIYNNSTSYTFVNVFANSNSPGLSQYNKKIIDAFKFNSDILSKALSSLSPPVYAELLEGDPSTLLVDLRRENGKVVHDGRCIGMNAAHKPKGLIYLEGAIRYSRECLDMASKVLVLTDSERSDLFEYNAAVEEFSSGKDRLRKSLVDTYRQSPPFNSYKWLTAGLTQYEIDLVRMHIPNIRSLAELNEEELKTIGKHPAKLCDVHWLMRKYGSYTPGTY